MIPVTLQPEPPGFDQNVRKRGQAFLVTNPTPISKEFEPHQYWKWAAKEIYAAYRRICVYSCMYIPIPNGSIDHFLPKSRHQNQAYEWNNLRLAQHRMNSNKGDQIVLDPTTIQPGWFVLDFPSCLVIPGNGLPDDIKQQVETTIRVLKLNDDDSLVQERCDLMVEFSYGDVSLGFLEKRYPFLAAEVIRQDLEITASTVFKKP